MMGFGGWLEQFPNIFKPGIIEVTCAFVLHKMVGFASEDRYPSSNANC
jgi:hypothetical protein